MHIFNSMSDEELCKEFELINFIPNGPSFVLPSGKVVSLSDFFEYDEPMHETAVEAMICMIGDSNNIDVRRLTRNLFNSEGELTDIVFDRLMNDRGWVRLNTGTTQVDNRYYMVLPKKRPTNAQFDVIEQFIEEGEQDNQEEVIVFIEDSKYHPTSKVYPYKEYYTETIMKNIKRYYTSGVLYETVKPQENLFTEDDIKYLKDWIIDVIDYDMKATETELGDSRYVVYAEGESGGGHLFKVVDEANSKYIGDETTFGEVEPSRIEKVAKSIAESIITMIQDYDQSIIWDSTLKEIKEKCIKTLDNAVDDVLILEQVGGFDAVACEFDKKNNTLRVYSIEDPTIDLYRGKLK